MKTRSILFMLSAALLLTGLLFSWANHASAAAETVKPNTTTMADANSMQDQIVSKEREELDSLKTGDLKVFADLLADDAIFVDTHGTASKPEVVKNVAGFRLTEYSMDDIKFVSVSPNSGLIVYKITEKGLSHGKEFAADVHISALWTQRAGKWICLFSQETSAGQS
jgi:Domain of unknown function (DUF4440)